MNTYLLLRDNKQTGPYTATELAAKGLKPYDLVWLEGKSAAWRYPSEIEELRSFAPGVEEQPYDRFTKKQGEQSADSPVTAQQQAAAANTQQESQTLGKHIYVTMPGGKTPVPVAKKEEAAKPVARQSDQNASSATQKNTEKKAAASSYIISEEDDEQNSGLLKGYHSRKKEDDEINNGFLSDYEARKAAYSGNGSGGTTIKQTAEKAVEKPAVAQPKESWLTATTVNTKKEQFDLKALLAGSGKYLQDNKNLTRGLVAAVLILGGVVIGLVINAGREHPDTKALESLVKEIRAQQSEKVSSSAPANEKVVHEHTRQGEEEAPAATDNANNSEADPAPLPATAATNNPPAQQGMRHAVIKKDNNVVPPPQQNKSIVVPVSNPNNQPAENTTTVDTREKTNNQEMIEKARKNIYEQVRAEASAFRVGLLGGISDLDITLLNSSLYALDQVAVEVKYFGPEKKLVKTQTIIFNNVPAGKRRTLEVPSTKRGITIDYSITSINSKALGLASAGF